MNATERTTNIVRMIFVCFGTHVDTAIDSAHWLSYGLMGFLVLLFRFLALLQRSIYG